jgi:Predicted phosphoglycerate mutase, AP superfamily
MARSELVLRDHPVNLARVFRGDIPATMIWLFWGSDKISDMPAFNEIYGLDAALTSGVDVLQGLAKMVGMKILDIPGVTDGPDNDYAAQAAAALEAFEEHDLVVIHVEAPDEAGHAGSIDNKVEAIQMVDKEIVIQIRAWDKDALRVLIMPDHPTPIKVRTHADGPVPFMLYGPGFIPNGAKRFTEAEAKSTGVFIEEGYNIMGRLIK